MKRGRPRKPPELHLIQGTWRPDRHNFDAPEPEKKRPSCPKYFSDEKRKLWHKLVRQLEKIGVLSEIDGGAVKRCVNWTLKSDEFWAKLDSMGFPGNLQKAKKSGYVNLGVLLLGARMADEMADRAERALGMTPESRTYLKIHKRTKTISKVRSFLR
jgi:P27 family predicted phage terminase small subunit